MQMTFMYGNWFTLGLLFLEIEDSLTDQKKDKPCDNAFRKASRSEARWSPPLQPLHSFDPALLGWYA